jgi:hypothetical protein
MKWLKRILIGVVVIIAALVVFLFIKHEKRPELGQTGPEADALARKVQAAVGTEKWSEVGALYFDYGGRHQILWDRARGLARVDFGKKRALFRIDNKSGLAFVDGKEVTDAKKREDIITEGYRWYINDTFWLNPFASLFDQNVTRSITVDEDGNKGLLVSYGPTSGGVTPGDAYLWFAGEDGLPAKWKMWVSVIPVGGLVASWEEWKELPGGAKVSTMHRSALLDFGVEELRGGRTISEVSPGEDPFAALQPAPATLTATTTQPAAASSQPAR